MKRPVLAIGLDAADPELLERWMAEGHLPHLARICRKGAYGQLVNTVQYAGGTRECSLTELLWGVIWSGCKPTQTGYWGAERYRPDSYEVSLNPRDAGFDYDSFPPFYDLPERFKVGTFDLTAGTLVERDNGLQILGWGGHTPFTPSVSRPAALLEEIREAHSENPVIYKDNGFWWDQDYLDWFATAVQESARLRAEIFADLWNKEHWDLFVTTFGDPHSAGHMLMHDTAAQHALHALSSPAHGGDDRLREAFTAVDRAVGDMLREAGDDTNVVLFSPHGMGANNTDLYSMVFLPELLFRNVFPGRAALGRAEMSPVRLAPQSPAWVSEIWRSRVEPSMLQKVLRKVLPASLLPSTKLDLIPPNQITGPSKELSWMPSIWYQRAWSRMPAFALPAFSDGWIRINLQGRDAFGMVPADGYERLCTQIETYLLEVRCARTGKPIVREVLRTRADPLDDDPRLPDADLIVFWEDFATDVVEAPAVGRIGPVTYYRPGGHYRSRGFIALAGPDVPTGTEVSGARAVDIAPTILQLLGAEIPSRYDGRSVLADASRTVRPTLHPADLREDRKDLQ